VSPSAGSSTPVIYLRDSEIALNRNGPENMKAVWPQDGYGVMKSWCLITFKNVRML
jgi:hypothetical protein